MVKLYVMFFHLVTTVVCFSEVQQGDVQTQRGSRKGKHFTLKVFSACVFANSFHMRNHAQLYQHSYRIFSHFKDLFFYLNCFPFWYDHFSTPKCHTGIFSVIYVKTLCTVDKIMVGWGFIPTVIAFYGSVPDTSFCLPHCAVDGKCEGPRGVKRALLRSLMRPLIRLMRLL